MVLQDPDLAIPCWYDDSIGISLEDSLLWADDGDSDRVVPQVASGGGSHLSDLPSEFLGGFVDIVASPLEVEGLLWEVVALTSDGALEGVDSRLPHHILPGDPGDGPRDVEGLCEG